MKVYRVNKIIKKDKVKSNPDVLYLFGDNDIRKGLGGQAKEMRYESNCIGVSTKKIPSNDLKSFKYDTEYLENCIIILDDMNKVKKELITGKYKALVIPQIGVGLAKLPINAPRTYQFLVEQLDDLENYAKRIYL